MKSWCLEKLKSNEPNSGLGEIPVLQRLNIIWAVLRSLCPVWVTCTSLFAVPGNLPQRQMEYFWLCPWALVDLYWYNRTDWDGDVTHFGSSWWWAPFQEFLKAKSALVQEISKFLATCKSCWHTQMSSLKALWVVLLWWFWGSWSFSNMLYRYLIPWHGLPSAILLLNHSEGKHNTETQFPSFPVCSSCPSLLCMSHLSQHPHIPHPLSRLNVYPPLVTQNVHSKWGGKGCWRQGRNKRIWGWGLFSFSYFN